MIVSERIFIDTSPFIYLIQNHPEYYQKVADFLETELSIKEASLITSVMTVAEFLVHPTSNKNDIVIQSFRKTLDQLNIFVSNITIETAEKSAELRAKYKFLRAFDALQLASALLLSCDLFLTNDLELKKVTELNVVLVKDL